MLVCRTKDLCLPHRMSVLAYKTDSLRKAISEFANSTSSSCKYFHNSNTPFTRYNRLSNRLYNRTDNRLYRVNKHPTGCQTGLTTGLTTVLNEQLFVQPVVKPRCTTGLTTGCIHDTAVCHGFDNRLNVCIHDTMTTGLTTGCIVYTNIYPVVKPA